MTLLRKSLLIFVIWLHLHSVHCSFALLNLKSGSKIGTSSFRYGSTFSLKADTSLSLECPRRTLSYEFPKKIQCYFERAQSGVMGDLIEYLPSSTYGNQANTKLSKTFLAGNLIFLILDWIQKFKMGYIRGIREVQTVCNFADVATIASLIFAVPPLFRLLHELRCMVVGPTNNYNYESSKTRSVSRFIKNFGITSGVLYIIELFSEFVDGVVNHNISLGNDLVLKESFFSSAPKFVAFTVYGFWFVRCLSLWKRKVIGDLVHSKNLFENRDRKVLVLLCDRTVTTIIYGCFIALLVGRLTHTSAYLFQYSNFSYKFLDRHLPVEVIKRVAFCSYSRRSLFVHCWSFPADSRKTVSRGNLYEKMGLRITNFFITD